MKKKLSIVTIFTFLASTYVIAQSQVNELHIEDFCKAPTINLNGKIFNIKEDGFCNAIKEAKEENNTPDAYLINDINYTFSNLNPTNLVTKIKCNMPNMLTEPAKQNQNLALNQSLTTEKTKWQIRLYASHSFTRYGKSDFKMRSSRVNIDVKDLPIDGRDGHNWFNLEKLTTNGHNVFQIFDEPSNTFAIGFTKSSKNSKISHEFILSAFHPKEIFHKDTPVRVDGTVDGVAVNDVVVLNEPFDGYNQTPGELELVRNQNTKHNMIWTIGYRPRFKLLDGKAGSLIYSPGIEVGINTGQAYSAITKKDKWWQTDAYGESGALNYHGFGGTITNKIEYAIPGGRFGVHVENKIGAFKKKIPFLDGTQEYVMKFMGNSIGMTFKLYDSKKKKKSK